MAKIERPRKEGCEGMAPRFNNLLLHDLVNFYEFYATIGNNRARLSRYQVLGTVEESSRPVEQEFLSVFKISLFSSISSIAKPKIINP